MSGVLLIDKPEGPSSHDVVDVVRRVAGTRRVGHTGTLDPFASGLLILCIGKATRLVEYFHLLFKEYEAVVVLGERRDTDDPTGVVVSSSDSWQALDPARIEASLQKFEGDTLQRPPDYSARRKGGQRAYAAARRGEPLVLDSSVVRMQGIVVTGWAPPELEVRLTVSTGTYIRSFARDLGEELGCGGHLGRLRRTAIGPFSVDGAMPAGELDSVPLELLTPAEALPWLRRRRLVPEEWRALSVGQSIATGDLEDPVVVLPDEENRPLPVVMELDGRLCAIGVQDADQLRPSKVFHHE